MKRCGCVKTLLDRVIEAQRANTNAPICAALTDQGIARKSSSCAGCEPYKPSSYGNKSPLQLEKRCPRRRKPLLREIEPNNTAFASCLTGVCRLRRYGIGFLWSSIALASSAYRLLDWSCESNWLRFRSKRTLVSLRPADKYRRSTRWSKSNGNRRGGTKNRRIRDFSWRVFDSQGQSPRPS